MLIRTFPYLLFAIFLLAVGCKKSHTNSVTSYRLELVSGGGQTDTIGKYLPNGLYILPIQNGSPMHRGYIRFETMSCDNTPVDNDITFLPRLSSAIEMTELCDRPSSTDRWEKLRSCFG